VIEIADRVWTTWRELCEQSHKASIVLLFRSPLPREEARELVTSAVEEMYASFVAVYEDSDVTVGSWVVGVAPEGLMIDSGEKCDAFEDMLSALKDQLDRRGVEGSLDVYEPAELVLPPVVAPLIECRIRVAGERRPAALAFGWHSDTAMLHATLRVALAWWQNEAQDACQSITLGLLPAVPAGPASGIEARLREAVASVGTQVELNTATAGGARTIVVSPMSSTVTLIRAGADMAGAGWPGAVEELRGVLHDVSAYAAYAYLKHGSNRTKAVLSESLEYDWPPPPGIRHQWMAEAFEDSYAPDAFAVQLLGPGYAGRVPTGERWRGTEIGASVLVEHVDPASWFGQPFAPLGGWPFRAEAAAQPPPAVLSEARADLAGILFRDELLTQDRDR